MDVTMGYVVVTSNLVGLLLWVGSDLSINVVAPWSPRCNCDFLTMDVATYIPYPVLYHHGSKQLRTKVPVILTLGIMVLLMTTQLAHPADASKFVVWSGSRCRGISRTLDACGCSEVPAGYNAGYSWTYQGQTSAAYNSPRCKGVAHTHFTTSVSSCDSFGWKSFFVQC